MGSDIARSGAGGLPTVVRRGDQASRSGRARRIERFTPIRGGPDMKWPAASAGDASMDRLGGPPVRGAGRDGPEIVRGDCRENGQELRTICDRRDHSLRSWRLCERAATRCFPGSIIPALIAPPAGPCADRARLPVFTTARGQVAAAGKSPADGESNTGHHPRHRVPQTRGFGVGRARVFVGGLAQPDTKKSDRCGRSFQVHFDFVSRPLLETFRPRR